MKMLKRTTAAIIAAVSTVAMAASMAPAFAYDEADELINSYSNPTARLIAEYCISNGLSLEEAKEFADGYAERNPVSVARSSTEDDYITSNYYNPNKLAGSKHYITLIVTNTTTTVSGSYQMYLNSAYVESDDTYSLCPFYASASGALLSVNTSYGILTNMSAPAGVTTKPEVAFSKYGLNIDDDVTNEKSVYDAIYSSEITLDNNVAYDIYALGDVQHDGEINSKDTDRLLEYLVGSRTDLSFTYLDSNAGEGLHSAATNWLAADANENGSISMTDVLAIKRMPCYVEL